MLGLSIRTVVSRAGDFSLIGYACVVVSNKIGRSFNHGSPQVEIISATTFFFLGRSVR
jgi:hypothetical protein